MIVDVTNVETLKYNLSDDQISKTQHQPSFATGIIRRFCCDLGYLLCTVDTFFM